MVKRRCVVMDNLSQLKDIHLPSENISVFPLASGWWIVLAGIIALYFLIKFFIFVLKTSKKLYAKRLIERQANNNTLESAVKMSEILRRICLAQYPIAATYSSWEWIEFLNNKAKHKLDNKTANLLKDAPYIPQQSQMYNAEDVQNLRKF